MTLLNKSIQERLIEVIPVIQQRPLLSLELLEEVDQREQLQSWIGNDQTCAGQPKVTSCWMELTSQPDCYVWKPNLQPDGTATWTGTCTGGRAQGEGTLKWVWDGGKKTSEFTGSLTDGKMHGPWVERLERCTARGLSAWRAEMSMKARMWRGRGTARGSCALRTAMSMKARMWRGSCTARESCERWTGPSRM